MKKILTKLVFLIALVIAFSSQALAAPEGRYTRTEEAVQYVRDQMKARTQDIQLTVSAEVYSELDLAEMSDVFAHTGNPDEGDALLCACGFRSCSASYQPGGDYLLEYVFGYYDTAEEEEEARQAILGMADELELTSPGVPALEKIQRIYNKVTYTVTYDWENLYTDEHPEKYTAYSAAVEGLSVCQGISSLVYRLALTAGIECRVITSDELDHAWNIVEWNGLYYNLDATWDLANGTDFYFMRGSSDFYHVNEDDAFQDAAFAAAHPLSRVGLNMLTQDNTLPILAYLREGEKHALDDGRTLHLTSDGRNKVLVFFWYNCPVTPLVLEDFSKEDFGSTDLYFCEFKASSQEENELATDWIRNELPYAANVTYLRNDRDYTENPGGNDNYFWMWEMEKESGLSNGFANSPTIFLVNGDNQILYACYGYSEGLSDLIHAYFSGEVSAASGMTDDGGSHNWDDTHVIANPTAATPGTKMRVCTECGKTETYRIDAPGAVLHGQCGDEAYWTFDTADDTLTIFGSGSLWDRVYTPNPTGWLNGDDFPAEASSKDYFYANRVKKVTICEGIKKIGGSMFKDFVQLTELSFPEGVTEIGTYGYPVFENTPALSSVTFPSTLKAIDVSALYKALSLKTVTFSGDAILMIWIPTGVTIRYPNNNPTWTQDVLDGYQNNGGILKPFAAAERADTPGSWKQNSYGWWYQRADGTYPKNEWDKIGGKWYHFDAKGYIQTGWQKISDRWYYFSSSGAMQTGWKQISGKWYFFSASGMMQTGWQKISGKWYYFNKSGAMQTGWLNLNGKYYYFTSGGAMVTGWKQIKDVWYFFKPSGVMAAKEWYDGYYLNADGSWTYQYKASWKQNAKGWWFGDTSGWYAKNCTITINDKSYTFDANGYMQ